MIISGIRFGILVVIIWGFKEEDMIEVVDIIYDVLINFDIKENILSRVKVFCEKYFLYKEFDE